MRTPARDRAIATAAALLALLAAACDPTPITRAATTPEPALTASTASTASTSSPTDRSAISPGSPAATRSHSSTADAAGRPVHVSLLPGDGAHVGVGMPIIAMFDATITDGRPFAAATAVTANGTSVPGAWYFEHSDPSTGHPMQAHFRPQRFWPAHARIHLDLPVKGLSAGTGLVYDDSLTLDYDTGGAHLGVVNDATHTITITDDDKPWGTFPVSLGASDPTMRTYSGWKVIMEKLPTVCMHNVENTYHDCGIKWDQRLTYSGEYLHAAPWNCAPTRATGCQGPYDNIGHADSSNGCTNLTPADALALYNFLQIGDPIDYPNANGQRMQLGTGYGDWNVPWTTWRTGGAAPTN
jgi:lipoprotein-anchoring transpeptidase ErfK/SrfK